MERTKSEDSLYLLSFHRETSDLSMKSTVIGKLAVDS